MNRINICNNNNRFSELPNYCTKSDNCLLLSGQSLNERNKKTLYTHILYMVVLSSPSRFVVHNYQNIFFICFGSYLIFLPKKNFFI